MADKIEGKMGFDKEENKVKTDIISKEETMFRVGADGKALPEKFPILVYDYNIDKELIEESILLMESLKKRDAITKVLQKLKNAQKQELEELKRKIDVETDKKVKLKLQLEYNQLNKAGNVEDIKSQINGEVISDGIAESRSIIQELKELKERQTKERCVELIPCTTSEAYLAFEKGKTVEGKDTPDWVADLISKHCKNPQFTFDEAKRLRPDYKIAIKRAIMKSSDYNLETYRDVMLRKRMETKKPLTIKKEQPIGETTNPAESV